jgi:hypothetical protein
VEDERKKASLDREYLYFAYFSHFNLLCVDLKSITLEKSPNNSNSVCAATYIKRVRVILGA